MFGYYDIELDLEGLNWTAPEISDVLIGESPAISLVALNERKLRFQVHGSPVAGNASVRLFRHDGAEIPSGVVFKFLPPNTTETMSIGAIGASLTQGVQRGVPSTTSILAGPAARFAQQLGVYFPLPLLIPDAFREMEVSDLGPPPYCNPPALDTFQQEQAIDLIDSMTTEEGRFDFALGRLSPDIQTHNYAVGGMRVRELLDGPPNNDIALNFLSHLVYQPSGGLGTPLVYSQMDMLELLSPRVVICFDCLGNDLIEGMINNEPFDLSEQTPMGTLLSDVDALVARLAALPSFVFIATLPKPNVLPFFELKKTRLVAEDIQPNADDLLAQLGRQAETVNARLRQRAEVYENVHVVDLAAIADAWLENGVRVGEETLYIEPLGGLVGLDGLHFTDVGYALLANAFIDTFNAALGENVARIDVSSVRDADRERPAALISAGLRVENCRGAL